MYLVNEILVFSPGRHKEAVDRLEYIHGLMATAPGFRRGVVGRYLGGATRHTVLRFWEDEAAYQAFRAGPNGNYGRNRPEGLYTNERVVPAWNSVVELNGDAQGDFFVKVQQSVPKDAWDAFIRSDRQLAEAIRARGGLVVFGSFRSKDQSEALAVARFRGRDDFDAVVEDPAINQILAGAPEGLGEPKFECFQVVSEIGPKS